MCHRKKTHKITKYKQLCLLPLPVLNGDSDNTRVELGRYRVFKSVSVFVFLVGFSKVGIGFGIGFSKYRDIGFGFRFSRTNLPLLIE